MNKLFPLILRTLFSIWTVSAQRVYAGQSIEEILALPEDQIDTGHACLVLAKDAFPDLNVAAFDRLLDKIAGRPRACSTRCRRTSPRNWTASGSPSTAMR
ncbi:MAG TPA: hypothetical protein PLT63_06575 [Syntrophales bacterium]|nr:hypothetical protein [Syntrophales bacterium]